MKPQTAAHTLTPWKTVKARTYVHIQDERNNCVASCAYEQKESNAAFIVRAVNSHKELLDCLTILKDCFSDNDGECENFEATISRDTLEKVEKAIAKAEGR